MNPGEYNSMYFWIQKTNNAEQKIGKQRDVSAWPWVILETKINYAIDCRNSQKFDEQKPEK